MAAGDIITPGRDVAEWQNSRLMVAQDANGAYRIVGVDAGGRILISAEIEVGDIQIGAVELKDHDSGVRADIAADGAQNALYVQSNSLLTRLNLLLSEATGTTMNTRLGAIETATEIIDNIVGAAGGADPGGIAIIGSLAETTVPGAAADGSPVQLNMDEYGRPRLAGYDPATGALQIEDVSPAQMQKVGPQTITQLTGPGGSVESIDVQDYENVTIVVAVDIDDGTYVDFGIQLSQDGGASWGLGVISGNDGTGGGITVNGCVARVTVSDTYSISVSGAAVQRARIAFVGDDGTSPTIDGTIMAGN